MVVAWANWSSSVHIGAQNKNIGTLSMFTRIVFSLMVRIFLHRRNMKKRIKPISSVGKGKDKNDLRLFMNIKVKKI